MHLFNLVKEFPIFQTDETEISTNVKFAPYLQFASRSEIEMMISFWKLK